MAEGYIQEFYAGIVKLNAAMDVRRLVLDETLKHLNTLQTSSHDDPEPEGGVNFKYGVTSNLTADLTYNPDFSQIESDQPGNHQCGVRERRDGKDAIARCQRGRRDFELRGLPFPGQGRRLQ